MTKFDQAASGFGSFLLVELKTARCFFFPGDLKLLMELGVQHGFSEEINLESITFRFHVSSQTRSFFFWAEFPPVGSNLKGIPVSKNKRRTW